ncbi:hypothetical protein EPUS_01499 [Endocarpon pusillum Z07020]|uniref:Heterokaryon incompatibility domain-containing protein n=1 Tax=Endocarpon pusillum (strain Z07020 / HMAS-L-300199) TaxID=1263415 RepID=U1HZ55_ENDPU|nr:uncharacterized protein EPUS_01499 [Endocarpon pusillum Z07020]ERF76165.1 hypothetical protein EPUS_01499 [Endocarpon pusillum Z07020]
MDHLPPPEHGRKPACFAVPLLGNTSIGNHDFWTFPIATDIARDKKGYLVPEGRNGDASNDESFFARVQTWLYFGLLREFFGLSFKPEDFIAMSPEADPSINSGRLTEYMKNWVEKSSKMPGPSMEAELRQKLIVLKTSWRFVNTIDYIELAKTDDHALVLFSIRALITTLSNMMYEHRKDDADPNGYFRINSDIYSLPELPRSYLPLVAYMERTGWCSAEIMRLLSTYTCTTVWYLACLHEGEPNRLDHTSCTPASACIARNITADTYRSTHFLESCQCAAIGPDADAVMDALRHDAIPLIRCTVFDDVNIDFKVVSSMRARDHFAISHVWADGMGVQRQNKIHTCHLLNILTQVRKAYICNLAHQLESIWCPSAQLIAERIATRKQSFLIWIDAFCIPDSLDSEAILLKRKGISQIDTVFAGSEAVLVMDRGLMKDIQDCSSTIELLGRLTTCGWMTRSWTYLEASLSQPITTYICTGTQLVSLFDVLQLGNQYLRLDVSSQGVYRDLITTLQPFLVQWIPKVKYLKPGHEEFCRFMWIWNALSDRAISRSEDMCFIVAMLMRLDVLDLMTCPEEERFAALIQDFPFLPRSFLCKNMPRIASGTAERRWLPSMVKTKINIYEDSFDFTDEGIIIGPDLAFKTLLCTDKPLLDTFSIGIPNLGSSRYARTYYTIRLHQPSSTVDTPPTTTSYCIALSANGSRTFETDPEHTDKYIRFMFGHGVCLKIRGHRADGAVEADYVTSLTYTARGPGNTPNSSLEHFDVEYVGATVIVPCGRTPPCDKGTDRVFDRYSSYGDDTNNALASVDEEEEEDAQESHPSILLSLGQCRARADESLPPRLELLQYARLHDRPSQRDHQLVMRHHGPKLEGHANYQKS